MQMNLREYINLIEAQDYSGMFKSLIDFMDSNTSINDNVKQARKNEINSYINWARKKLKKNDRIVWFLRLLKYAFAREIGIPEDQVLRDLNSQAKTNYTKHDLMAYDSPARIKQQLVTKLEHFFSMQIPEIDRYVFDKQSPNEVINHFDQVEGKSKGSAGDDAGSEEMHREGRLIPAEADDEVIMKFPDGYSWVDLQTPADDAEGKAMGHCGNRASYKSDETIFSLRKSVNYQGKKWWYPVCTFILDGNKFLGEMKGRANKKPAGRYHPYIIALLKSKYVDGIKGGGFAADQNFSLDDLDYKEKESLIDLKPELGGLEPLYQKEGMSKRVEEMLWRGLDTNGITHRGVTYDKANKTFEVYSWSNFDRFLREMYDEAAQEVSDIAQGYADWQVGTDTQQVFKNTVEELPENWQEKFMERAGEDDIDDAISTLIGNDDEWYQLFTEVAKDDSSVISEAWDRLAEYCNTGWSFACGGSLNIPQDADELKKFVTSGQPVTLSISEYDMVSIASHTPGDYDDYAGVDVDMISRSGWDAVGDNEAEWRTSQRRDDGLVDRGGDDTWVSDLEKDDDRFVGPYLKRLQGHSQSRIEDPRQGELLEAIRRIRQLAGLVTYSI